MTVRVLFDDWRYIVGAISGGHFLSHFYILAFPPLFPAWRAEFGLSGAELGLIMSASLVASLLQMPVGILVDRIGAKYVFIAGVGITSLGIVVLGFATSFLTLLGFALFSGIGQSAFHPADYAMLDASAPSENKGKSFSLHSFGGYAGFAAAPVVVGGLSILTTWRLALVIIGVAGVAYAILAFLTLPARYQKADGEALSGETPPLRENLRTLVSPTFLVIISFFVAFTIGLKGIQAFTPLLLVDTYGYAATVGNTALTAFFTTAAFGILLGGFLSDRFDSRIVLVVMAFSAMTVVLFGTAVSFARGPMTAILSLVVAGAFVGVIYPCRDRVVSHYSLEGNAGKSFGLVFTGTTIGGLVSPPALGYVIDVSAPTNAFILIGVAFGVAGVIIAALLRGDVSIPTKIGIQYD